MKRITSTAILCTFFLSITLLSFAQMGRPGGAMPPPSSGPGTYDPHAGVPGMNTPPPIEQRPKDYLSQNPKFNAKIQQLIPEGTTPIQVCDGFTTLGDCVAAIHASQNLAIPMADLKGKVTGKGSKNLEKGIHELKPDVDAKAERKKAWKQAEQDIPVSN
jgi:hypothetical protein